MKFVRRITLGPWWTGLFVAALASWPASGRGAPPSRRDEAPGRVRIVDPSRRPGGDAALQTPSANRKSRIGPYSGKIEQAQHLVPAQPAADPSADTDDSLQFLLDLNVTPIDLYSALRLAGEQNPQVLIAQQRVVEAVALSQLAAAQFLPTLNMGVNLDAHWGVLQQSTGNILSVQRDALFVGAGANAIAAGTVNIPGVVWNLNVSESIYNYLISQAGTDRSEFDSRATRQDVLLNVALAYTDLVRAEGARSVAILTRNDASELARLTVAYFEAGEGRKADADRTATELARREADVVRAEGDVVTSSAALCKLLHLDPTTRLHVADNQVVPKSVVPDPIPLSELLAIALLNRPELGERRAAVAQALLNGERAEVLPFSPSIMIGFSAGTFGGGSNLVAQPTGSNTFARSEPRFGAFGDRTDFDVLAYWTLQNLGVGNKAQIDAARSRVRSADLVQLETLDRIRSEVAAAHARTHARFAQIRESELAARSSIAAFEQDLNRIKGHEGLPLEAIDSLRLLGRSRIEYLNTILDYNKAQFELYVALGKPPADLLARPADQPPPDTKIDEDKRLDAGDELEGLEPAEVVPAAAEQWLIDLPTALRLAESENPTIALGRQAITEALALQTAARGLLLPSLNAGTMYHLHNGKLQTSFGEIRDLTEQSIYFGGGARTLAAETVAIPAVRIFSHLGDAVYAPLAAGQTVSSRSAQSLAVQNATLLAVVTRYLELASAEAELDAIHASENDMREVVLATAAFAKIGQGRIADFNRARSDALLLHVQEQRVQESAAVAAAELARVLHLDPSIRLNTQPGPIEIVQLVDPNYGVEYLVQLAQTARPELAARAADISAAQYRVQQENIRPFLPLVSVGFSGGAFGGGSNRQDLHVDSFFQHLGGRTDFDVFAVWSLQNLGFGNAAIQKQRRAERDQIIALRGLALNQISREVADAYARIETMRQQVALARRRLQTAAQGAREEINRTRGGEGLPLEALNSVNLLAEARRAMIEAVVGYDLAQFQLFVAIGQTPGGALPDTRSNASGVEADDVAPITNPPRK